MTSAKIRSKVEAILAKANRLTGSSSSQSVYLIKRTKTEDTPLNPSTYTESKALLSNAIFTSINNKIFDSDIKATDKQMISDYSVTVKQGDIIEQGDNRYIIINQSITAPTSDVLLYISQLRLQ